MQSKLDGAIQILHVYSMHFFLCLHGGSDMSPVKILNSYVSYTNLSGSNIMQVMLVQSGKLRIEALN